MNPMADDIKSRMEWDPKRGFKIPLKPYDNYRMITCLTRVDNMTFPDLKSHYILLRLGESF